MSPPDPDATDARLAEAEAALRREPDSVTALMRVAELHLRRGDAAQAVAFGRRALALAPDDFAVLRPLSGMLAESGALHRATALAEAARRAAPQDAETRLHLAGLLAAQGRGDEALATLDAGGFADTALADAAAALRATLDRRPPAQPETPATFPWQAAPPERPRHESALRIQARIVFALLLRETRVCYGATRLGYAWAVAEPIAHLLTLGLVFAYLNHGPPPVGDNLFLFYLTGVLPYLVFIHVSSGVMSALDANAGVLHLPLVSRVDVVLARALFFLATETLVGLIVFATSALLGHQGLPHDPLTALSGILALWLVGTGIGLVNAVLVAFWPSWETVYHTLTRLLYFASGIYLSPIVMPDWLRAGLAWNPILQGIDWFRSGFFAGYAPHWLDRPYLLLWAVTTLLLGLALERGLRHRLVVPT